MKTTRFLVQLVAACALITTAAAQTSGRYPVKLILLKELHSGGTPQGSIVPFMVDQDVKDENGNVVVKGGTPAYGEVVWSRREGALSAPVLDRPARLAIKLLQTYGTDNKARALAFGTSNEEFEFNRDNTSEGQIDPQLAAAWKDPEKRAIVQRLIDQYTGANPEPLSPPQQAQLLQDARTLSLIHAADLAQSGKLAPLGAFVEKLRVTQAPVYAAVPADIDPIAVVAAVQEMNQLTRASRGYIGGRFTGRNILAPAGLIVDGYVMKNP